jgi:hypothetical protein
MCRGGGVKATMKRGGGIGFKAHGPIERDFKNYR